MWSSGFHLSSVVVGLAVLVWEGEKRHGGEALGPVCFRGVPPSREGCELASGRDRRASLTKVASSGLCVFSYHEK